MASDLIRTAYQRAWWALVIRGVFAIAVGALIFWRPLDSIAAFALLIAVWALFVGIVQMVHAFQLRPLLSRWWVLLLTGIIGVAFGVAALSYYPGLSLSFAVIWTTWWLILTGVLAIYLAVWERGAGLAWGWTLAFGVLSIAAGVLAIMNPPATLAAILGLIGGFALASGVLLLIGAGRLAAAKAVITEAFHAGG
jgi:uncharacterized membrane protein HdeD (DUF308 family)